jgi:hypothetical protein
MSAKAAPGPDPDKVYVAITSFVSADFGGVPQGRRLLGSSPVVRAAFKLFAPDGADAVAMEQQLRELHPLAGPIPVAGTELLVALRDEDASLCVRNCLAKPDTTNGIPPFGCNAGSKVRTDSPLVRQNRDCFVSVTNGIPRADALVATGPAKALNGDGTTLYELIVGTWYDRSHRAVADHPSLFALPEQ